MDDAPANSAAFLRRVRAAAVPPGELALWYLGGAGYILRSAATTLLLDPYLGPSNPPDWVRALPPACRPDELPHLGPVAAVLLTHEHGDHTDAVALGALAREREPVVYGPAACIAAANDAGFDATRLVTLAHDQAVTIGDLRVTAVAMHDPGAPGCNGYVIEHAGVTLLQAGDSLYFDGFLALGQRWRFDAVCVSVGGNPPGKTFYLDESGAGRVARDTGTRLLIPQHFDLWRGITLDPSRIRTATRWYAPQTRVMPARFQRRISLSATP